MFVDANIHQLPAAETEMKHRLVSYRAKPSVAPCPQVKSEVSEAFLPPPSPGQIHGKIDLFNLTETFQNPCSAAACVCASQVPPGLICLALLRHLEWHYTCLHFFPVFAMA